MPTMKPSAAGSLPQIRCGAELWMVLIAGAAVVVTRLWDGGGQNLARFLAANQANRDGLWSAVAACIDASCHIDAAVSSILQSQCLDKCAAQIS